VNAKEIRALLELLREYGLTEIEVEREGERLRLRREPAAPPPASPTLAAAGPTSAPATPLPRADTVSLLAIEAPMVGTFYRASAPDAQPFVREGDLVKKGQVVCIIEAMKLMNEIESKVAGRVTRVLVENAQPVEYGQPLFALEP
jgi:acetyl-CoA carboxylase biotin carboxyl carrier protein